MKHEVLSGASNTSAGIIAGTFRLLDIKEVMATLNKCQSAIHKAVADGTMPKPVKLGRSTRWRSDDLAAYVDSLSRDFDAVPAGHAAALEARASAIKAKRVAQ
jgi:predicted DNA-binding transcriptional regulator AlpA